jgi:hypothetical protein
LRRHHRWDQARTDDTDAVRSDEGHGQRAGRRLERGRQPQTKVPVARFDVDLLIIEGGANRLERQLGAAVDI